MKITFSLAPPLALHQTGPRDHNEDAIYPPAGGAHTDGRLYLVCDGVGGREKGEVASQLACQRFVDYFSSQPPPPEGLDPEAGKSYILEAFNEVQTHFDTYKAEHPDTKGMATTLTLAYLHAQGITVAHCGDSRVYHIRGGDIRFCTTDHTPVNDLLRAGIITEEEAAEEPPSSKISRAIQGHEAQRTRPDVTTLTDLQTGDYLLLCTDGVTGSLTDEELCAVLSSADTDNASKVENIRELCQANATDNYSLYLLQLEDVEIQPDTEPPTQETRKKEPKPEEAKLSKTAPSSKKGFFENLKDLFK